MKALKKQSTMTLIKTQLIILLCTLSALSYSQNKFDYKQNIKPSLLRSFDIKSDSLASLNLSAKTNIKKQNYNHFYQAHLGLFCKFENDILKSANIPVRMRLGSTEYVDELEQKTPAYRTIDK